MRRVAVLAALLLTACVTTAPSPVDGAFTSVLAPPAVVVTFTDEDGLPAAYDEAVRAFVPDAESPLAGAATAYIERELAAGLTGRLAEAYTGDAPAALRVEVVNVILPDRTRFTPLSGMKSFAVTATLTGADGTVLAETRRPFTVLSEMQGSVLGGSEWRRLGRTEALRAEAIVTLTEAAANAVAEAMGGGRAQTGLSGGLAAYPERLPR
jgi:hypothetical protein